jgi:uncharacterized protein YbjQ (UPF0145 family)
MKFVYKTKIYSRNFVSDFGAGLKNIIGGRLRTYEKMLNKAIDEATSELIQENPQVKDIKLQITEFQNASISITAYGVVDDK